MIKMLAGCLFFIIFCLLSVRDSAACECLDSGSVCTNFANADAVVIGKIESFAEVLVKTPRSEGVVQKVRVEIKKSFKGVDGKFITLAQPNTSCDWQFKDTDKGKDFLFYLEKDLKTGEFTITVCGRSRRLSAANDDLSWLNGLPRSLERTRFSGVLSHYEDVKKENAVWANFTFIDYLVGTKIKIFSAAKVFEVYTDKNGMYEIWDLPAGKYKIAPEIPEEFFVHDTFPRGTVEYKKLAGGREDSKDFTIEVPRNGCAGIDYTLKKTNK